MVAPAIIGAGISAAGSLLGGIFGRRSAKKQNNQDWLRTQQIRKEDRANFLADRARDRKLFEGDRHNDRLYARRVAEKVTESRGIDWSRLRQEAEAAGYNPLTALGMAGAYSTELGYGSAGGAGTSGGSAGMGPVGGSYQSQFNPALASGSFISEAIDRGVDTWFNTPQQGDRLADALRVALSEKTWQDMQSKTDFRRDFGYSLNPPRLQTASVRTAGNGLAKYEEGGIKTFTGPSGRPWQVGPGSPAEDVEEQYGEPGSALQGIGNLIYDAGQSARRWAYGFDVTLEDDERNDPGRRRPIPSKWKKPALARGPSHRARNTAIQRDRYRQSIGGW